MDIDTTNNIDTSAGTDVPVGGSDQTMEIVVQAVMLSQTIKDAMKMANENE